MLDATFGRLLSDRGVSRLVVGVAAVEQAGVNPAAGESRWSVSSHPARVDALLPLSDDPGA